MSAMKKTISLWDETSTETTRVHNDGVKDAVDVAIVGAGFTGLSPQSIAQKREYHVM